MATQFWCISLERNITLTFIFLVHLQYIPTLAFGYETDFFMTEKNNIPDTSGQNERPSEVSRTLPQK